MSCPDNSVMPRIAGIFAAILLFCNLDCSLAQPLEFIQISNAPYFKPKTPAEIKTIEDAMAAVITITSKELGLPVVDPLTLHLHKDTNSYAAGAGRSGRLGFELVQFSAAVAQGLRFPVNMERVRGRPWSALMKLLAHEFTHNIEYLFSWPLESGKEWRDPFVLENLEQKSSRKFENLHVVAGLEEISVPAGTFESIKIDTYAANGGALLAEHWYAPGAKWFVKTRDYLQDGVREEELTSLESK